MEKIRPLWLEKKEKNPPIPYESLYYLKKDKEFVGFIPDNAEERCIVTEINVGEYVAVTLDGGLWVESTEQRDEPGEYFATNSKEKFTEWLNHE